MPSIPRSTYVKRIGILITTVVIVFSIVPALTSDGMSSPTPITPATATSSPVPNGTPGSRSETSINQLAEFWEGLRVNLLSSLMEILVTVFFIDRLLKKRENARWQPVQNQLFAELFETTDMLLFWLVPHELRERRTERQKFGDVIVNSVFCFREGALPNVRATVQSRAAVHRQTTFKQSELAFQQVELIRRFSLILPDAQLFHFLLRLDLSLSRLKEVAIGLGPDLAADEEADYADAVESVIKPALDLHTWLMSKAQSTTLSVVHHTSVES